MHFEQESDCVSVFERGELNSASLCNQSFLYKNASSADESSAKVLFKHPSTTFVYTKT